MSSNAKRTKIIRGNKISPNKANQKADRKRIKNNAEVLRELAAKDKA